MQEQLPRKFVDEAPWMGSRRVSAGTTHSAANAATELNEAIMLASELILTVANSPSPTTCIELRPNPVIWMSRIFAICYAHTSMKV